MAVFDTNHTDTQIRSIITWYHHGNGSILPNHRINISSSPLQSVIVFAPLLIEDKGTIQCVVTLEPVGNQNGFILPSEEGIAALTLGVEGDVIKILLNLLYGVHTIIIYHKLIYHFLPQYNR